MHETLVLSFLLLSIQNEVFNQTSQFPLYINISDSNSSIILIQFRSQKSQFQYFSNFYNVKLLLCRIFCLLLTMIIRAALLNVPSGVPIVEGGREGGGETQSITTLTTFCSPYAVVFNNINDLVSIYRCTECQLKE